MKRWNDSSFVSFLTIPTMAKLFAELPEGHNVSLPIIQDIAALLAEDEHLLTLFFAELAKGLRSGSPREDMDNVRILIDQIAIERKGN